MSPLLTISIALIISVSAIIILTRYLNVHAFFALLLAALICGIITGIPIADSITLMQEGFGLLLKQIGFLVALGSCLGMMLEKTGAMEVISKKVVGWFGSKKSTLALSFTGVVVGIPVFCDSGFIILSRLIPSIASQTSVMPSQLTLALSSGLYTTHTLVPPTPGPLAAAMNFGLGEQISTVMLLGIVASIPVGIVAYLFSLKLSRMVISTIPQHTMVAHTNNVNSTLAFLPLILPIVLIAMSSLPEVIDMNETVGAALRLIGNPIAALSIGLLLSFPLLHGMGTSRSEWPTWLQDALKDAGMILLITGAGGAFGSVIKASGIAGVLKEYVSGSSFHGVIFVFIAFLISAVLKTAQGSTTTAMIITSGLLVPLAGAADFDTPVELSALVIAIGGGGMTVSHANDSYFWVVSQFGGISPKDAFRSFTLITLAQGLTALAMAVLIFLFA
jgi:gluconate:H+ symporter, GntP family